MSLFFVGKGGLDGSHSARFSGLSSDAKILYGLMLDRMSLSLRNEWHDDQDRTYIVYTIEQIMEDLNCSKDKAIRVMAELDNKKGIGLIEKVRRGLGKPDLIYEKNFIGVERIADEDEKRMLKQLQKRIWLWHIRKQNMTKKKRTIASRNQKKNPQSPINTQRS